MLTSEVHVTNLSVLDRITDLIKKNAAEGLRKAGALIFKDATSSAPRHIADNIRVGDVVISGDRYSIRVYVLLGDAPDAGAWEYGSGLHRTKPGTTPGKYPIDAKNVPDLVFFWERKQKWFVGPHVNHPGIVGRPYLRPALWNNKTAIDTILQKSVTGN